MEGLAFEIFEVKDGKKDKIRKIYLNSHIEGFEGDPVIFNYIYPRIMMYEARIKQLEEENKELEEEINATRTTY